MYRTHQFNDQALKGSAASGKFWLRIRDVNVVFNGRMFRLHGRLRGKAKRIASIVARIDPKDG
jgi:hypothetical protein